MNKTVLITGATSGMGKETALLLAEHGYTVYAGVRNTSQELIDETKKRGVKLNTVTLDVQDTASGGGISAGGCGQRCAVDACSPSGRTDHSGRRPAARTGCLAA